jgi:flagellar FliL protein
MSDKKSADGAEDGAAPKKKKLLLFIIIGVVVVALGAVAAIMLLKKPPAEDGEDGDEPPAKHEKAKKKSDGGHGAGAPVFVKLDPFTVKLQTEQQEAYLQATPELQVSDAPVGERVKQFTPALRHKITLILMSRKASDIASPKGVQSLANEMRYEVNKIIDGPKTPKKKSKKSKQVEEDADEIPAEADPNDSVQAVLFTQFIIQ